MRSYFFLVMLLTGCQSLPQLFQATEDIADDTAVKIEVSREALAREPNLQVTVDLKNKDVPAVVVPPMAPQPAAK